MKIEEDKLKLYTMPKSLIVLIWIVILGAIGLMGWMTFDSIYPPVLIKFYDRMIPIARNYTKCDLPIQEFYPGDIVPLRFRGYKYTTDIPRIVTRMINDSVTELPPIHISREIGPFDDIGLSRRIPLNSHPGLFYFDINYIYNRNFLRSQETYRIRTEPFRILPMKKNHDTFEDEALIKKILKELQQKNKKEWDHFKKEREQFERDRQEFEQKKSH